METKKMLNVSEMGKRLGLCRNASYKLVKQVDFYPSFRIGKKICVDADLLEKWIVEKGQDGHKQSEVIA